MYRIVIFMLSGLLLIACDEKKITVKGADGTEYESYQECCAAQDFQAAHQYLAKMQNDENFESDFYSAKEFVFKQEALYLMSQGDEVSKKRIVYLLKEEGGNDKHLDMLVDLAIDNDDEPFVKILSNQYKGKADEETLKKIVEYLSGKNSDENRTFLMSLLKRLGEMQILINYAINKNDKELINDYLSTNSFSFRHDELINYMVVSKERKYADMIIGQLKEEEGQIPQKPLMGRSKYWYQSDGEDFKNKCESYSSHIKDFNALCSKILGQAIKFNNQYLAQRVMSKFRSNVHIEGPGESNNYYTYNVTSDFEEINAAKATYQEAVRSGAFK